MLYPSNSKQGKAASHPDELANRALEQIRGAHLEQRAREYPPPRDTSLYLFLLDPLCSGAPVPQGVHLRYCSDFSRALVYVLRETWQFFQVESTGQAPHKLADLYGVTRQ